jgi:hypothetical protein
MGYYTYIEINNDRLNDIRDDPEGFGEAVVDAIQGRRLHFDSAIIPGGRVVLSSHNTDIPTKTFREWERNMRARLPKNTIYIARKRR